MRKYSHFTLGHVRMTNVDNNVASSLCFRNSAQIAKCAAIIFINQILFMLQPYGWIK